MSSSSLPEPQVDANLVALQASTNYKEAFSLFDKRGTGRVPVDSLGDLLRACGQNPTLGEITELEKGVGKDCKLTSLLLLFLFIPKSLPPFAPLYPNINIIITKQKK